MIGLHHPIISHLTRGKVAKLLLATASSTPSPAPCPLWSLAGTNLAATILPNPPPPLLLPSRAGLRRSGGDGRTWLMKQPPRLLIFDKDGTLICFHSLWVPWLRTFIAQVDQATRLGLSHKLFRALGFCPVQRKVKRGLLAEGTMGQIRDRVAQMLVQNGLDKCRARDIVEKAAQHSSAATTSAARVRQICNLEALFRQLKGRGIKIAVCTADSRQSTMRTLNTLGVESLIDLVVCGDDRHSKPKPDPGNALFICHQLGVPPADAMVIGDTPADMGMGRSARLGSTVGVLSGVGEQRDLEPQADHLVEDVGELVRLIGTS